MTTLRGVTRGLIAAGLVLSLAACGEDGPGRAEIVAKIKSDPGMSGTPDTAVDCVADWYMKFASAQDRTAFVNGKTGDKGLDEVAGSEEAKAAILDCLKGAAQTP